MATRNFAGVAVDVDEEGYLTDSAQWTEKMAAEIAKEEGIELTDKHMIVVNYIRECVAAGEGLTIRGINKSGLVDAKTFYQLFPGAPLKKATKIAGVPKPISCI
ncbi:MAG: TusE/DsrC/DsvC family sulfur relay protein [Bacteroidales bacterium]|nr:TusE/DsrC/DsvC family sulfur relay protein [Bacteroidales bacterium]